MIDAQQVQHGGVQIVGRGGFFDGLVRPLIRGAIGNAPADAATGQPVGIAEGIMVPAQTTLANGCR